MDGIIKALQAINDEMKQLRNKGASYRRQMMDLARLRKALVEPEPGSTPPHVFRLRYEYVFRESYRFRGDVEGLLEENAAALAPEILRLTEMQLASKAKLFEAKARLLEQQLEAAITTTQEA